MAALVAMAVVMKKINRRPANINIMKSSSGWHQYDVIFSYSDVGMAAAWRDSNIGGAAGIEMAANNMATNHGEKHQAWRQAKNIIVAAS